MDIRILKEIEKETKKFLFRIADVKWKYSQEGESIFFGCKETAALKRSSMDLSRLLSILRK